MGREERPKRTRREKEIRLAVGLTIGWAVLVLFLIYPQGPLRAIMLPSVIAGTAVLAVIWCLVFLSLRLRTERDQSLDQLQALPPDKFEEWVAARFREIGYRVKPIAADGDRRAHLLAEKPGERAVVLCRRSKNWRLGESALRDLYAAVQDLDAQHGYLVTTASVATAARHWAHGKPLAIWDGEELARLARAPAPPTPETSRPPKVGGPPGPTCPCCGALLVVRYEGEANEAILRCSRYPRCWHQEPMP